MSVGVGNAETVAPARRVRGRLRVPGDKSISHRYGMLAALARGTSRISRYAPGADCAATLACLEALGVAVRGESGSVEITGRGLGGLLAPKTSLDAQNSGTTMRLMAGILAAHPFESILTGDDSLRRRPMQRVIDPLTRMGARIRSAEGGRAPLRIAGASLQGIDFTPAVPSAQVKSAVLLAGLQARGATRVREPFPTRDHTERALTAFGAQVLLADGAAQIEGGQALEARSLTVPGDVSSAAFWAAAAAALPGSEIEMADVGLNPTRIHVLDVLRRAGAAVEADVQDERAGEPVGTIRVRHQDLTPLVLTPDDVPGLIDELPVLAAMSALGGGIRVTGAGELRGKESDRIACLVAGLRGLGAEAVEFVDGFEVAGGRTLQGGTAAAAGDHRLAMAFAIAALGAHGPSTITGAEAVQVSYPGFFDVLRSICE
jgi:3-phosphoshikimate 1-carboxyvinyltransferase